eukprot:243233_1
MGSSKSKQTAEQKEQIEKKEERDQIEEMENMVSNIERVIEGNPNPTLPHLVQLFSNAISVQSPQLHCFKEIVETMKTNWNKLTKCLDALGIHVNNGDRKVLLSLQRDYWGLLFKTRSVMAILIKKCQIQQRDIRILLAIIAKAAQHNGELTNDERSAHKECVQSLGEWIETKELQTLYNEWKDICVRLQEQQMSWKEKVEHFKQSSKNTAMQLLKIFGIILVGAAVISLIIFSVVAISAATHGAAAPVAAVAGGAAVKSVTVFGVSILTTHALGIGISIGVLGVGSAVWGGYKMWERTDAACQAYKNADKITTMLGKMIKNSEKMENHMKVLDDTQQAVKAEVEYLKNPMARIRMKESLCAIDGHLADYIKQGQDVIKTVNGACKKYIK